MDCWSWVTRATVNSHLYSPIFIVGYIVFRSIVVVEAAVGGGAQFHVTRKFSKTQVQDSHQASQKDAQQRQT
jgi:hypothetical protein